MYPQPVDVRHLGEYRLKVTFEGGTVAVLDFAAMTRRSGPLFAPLRDVRAFAGVRVNAEAGTLVWPTGVDICPDVLYHLATGAAAW